VGAQLAAEEFPARWTARSRLGEACLALDDRSAARAAYAKALELHPGDARLTRAMEQAEPR
jgi:Flp pilus assembly protein TadD